MKEKILEVKNLEVSFKTYAGISHAVRGIDFDLHKGETLAIVGESGCGKTVSSKAIMRLLPESNTIINENSNIYNNLKEIFLKIIQVYSHKYYGFELEIKALLFSFFANIFRENLVIKKDSILSDDSKVFKIKDVIKYIENNYRNDINITTLANICHYNEYHFMRFFKKYTGKTCIQFIKNYRLEKAYNLLKNTDLPVTQISFDVGFSNVSYFIRSFKEKYKVTPKELRLRADDSFNV